MQSVRFQHYLLLFCRDKWSLFWFGRVRRFLVEVGGGSEAGRVLTRVPWGASNEPGDVTDAKAATTPTPIDPPPSITLAGKVPKFESADTFAFYCPLGRRLFLPRADRPAIIRATRERKMNLMTPFSAPLFLFQLNNDRRRRARLLSICAPLFVSGH